MAKKESLQTFSLAELQVLKQSILEAKTKEELLSKVDALIKQKEYAATESMNARFPVDWFNIDQPYIALLHANGIHNLAQLRDLNSDELSTLNGMTRGGLEQISWARDFFDMTPIERIPEKKRNDMEVAKVIVKHANECRKKHPNV